MPSITIREVDNTTVDNIISTSNVVYVPGFINASYINADGSSDCVDAFVPTLCTSVSEFEKYFGAIPAAFETPGGEKYKSECWARYAFDAQDAIMFEEGTMDPGYVYAKELLTAGLPVLYERVNTDTNGADITVDYMYQVLSEVTDHHIWENLKDINEYNELKFLTSGGYPTFEYSSKKLIYTCADIDRDMITLAEDTFKANFGENKLPIPTASTTYKFTWAKAKAEAYWVADIAELQRIKNPEIGEYYWVEELDALYTYKQTSESAVEPVVYEWIAVDPLEYEVWTAEFKEAPENTYSDANLKKTWGLTLGAWISKIDGCSISVIWNAANNSTIVAKMLSCASTRGDCVALIDHTNYSARPVDATNIKSVYYSIANTNSDYSIKTKGEYGAMFTPWCGYPLASALYNTTTYANTIEPEAMPGSFGYLKALAEYLQSSTLDWMAIAGTARGAVDITKPNLINGLRISNAIADDYQPRDGIAINAITNIKPYGYLIWGNRTLKNNALDGDLTASSFLNMRNMVSGIAKLAYTAAKKYMFEQNSDILWINYTSILTEELDSIVSGGGLVDYEISRISTTERAKIACKITLYPVYAVEAFDITIELTDDELSVY